MKRKYSWNVIALIGFLSNCATVRQAHLKDDKFENACNEGNAIACQCAAGDALIKPIDSGAFHSGEHDFPTQAWRESFSEEFIQKACKLGDQEACNHTRKICAFDSMSTQERCDRGEKKSCALLAKKVDDDRQAAFNALWEGSESNGLSDLRSGMNFQYANQWALFQIFKGWVIFKPIRFDNLGWTEADFTVAIKQSSLKGVDLVQTLHLPYAASCIRFLGNQNWENQSGFPVTVKTYQAEKCAEK